MILDTQLLFSGTIAADGTRSAQAITATANSTNVIDLRNATTPTLVDEGIDGETMWLVVQVGQIFNTLTSLTIALVSDSATSLASSPVTHYSASILLATLAAGATVVRIPLPSADYKRYLGLIYTVVGSNPSTGTLNAFLTMDVNRNVIYPSSFTLDV